MDDPAFVVQVVETKEDLFRDLLDNVLGHTAVLIPLDQTKQVFTKDFEYHTYMRSVGAGMSEVVDEADDVTSTGMRFGRGDDSLQKLNLVESGLGIVTIRFDDFERDVPACTVCERDSKGPRVTGW